MRRLIIALVVLALLAVGYVSRQRGPQATEVDLGTVARTPTLRSFVTASGEIVAAYSWNDAPKNLAAQGIPVAYAKPKEGYFTWYCGMTILNSGKGDDVSLP